MFHRLTLVAVGVALAVVGSGALIERTSDPFISPDGETIVFSYQADLWLVNSEGGMARRITRHPGDEIFPVFDQTGSKIAFASNRYGSNDVFTMDRNGQNITRLTFDSNDAYPTSFSPDGNWVYGYTTAWGRINLFKVSTRGGETIPLTYHPLELSHWATVSPDARTVVYNLGGSPGGWRRETNSGSNVSQIWAADNNAPLNNHRQLIASEHYYMFPRFIDSDRLVFVSNRSGTPNIWTSGSDGSNLQQITRFNAGTIRVPTADSTGTKFAYQKDSAIWVYDSNRGSSRKIPISAPGDELRNSILRASGAPGGPDDFAVSPDGLRAVVNVRGLLFLIPASGGTTRQLTFSPKREYSPTWLNDSTILFSAAGTNGKRELKTVNIDGEISDYLSHSTLDLHNAKLSPDRKYLAAHRGINDIAVFNVESKQEVSVAKGTFAFSLLDEPSFSWSPDSKYITYTINEGTQRIYVFEVETGVATEVGRLGKEASAPRFLPNGKAVFFTGSQGLEYSETRMGLPSLFIVDLVPGEVIFTEDDLDLIGVEQEPAGDPEVEVEERGIFDRIRQLASSVTAAFEGRINTIYANVQGQFSSVNTRTGAATPVAGVTGVATNVKHSPGNNSVYFVNAGQLRRLNLSNNSVSTVSISPNYEVDVKAEEEALFEEIWWLLDRLYYDREFYGVDWPQIKAQYAQLVPHAWSRSDFYNLMNEMVHRLDSSHLGASFTPEYTSPTPDATAFLGVRFRPADLVNGRYVVDHVYALTPADHPDMRLKVGDVITAVQGQQLSTTNTLSRLLNRRAGQRTTLAVRRDGEQIEIDFQPASPGSATAIYYLDWVRWQREETERLSNNRLTYLHIQGMNAPSLDTFLREIATITLGKEGAIVDVRFNGGGFTGHIILNTLLKRPWLIRTNPDQPGVEYSENIYRGNALELPTAAMINQHSFSNAEIFAEGFRQLGLGPIIGEPTAGGVIGTYGLNMWDGGSVRLPAAGAYTIDGEDLERSGRHPDHYVSYDPNAFLQGRDVQLEKAVEVLLQQIP